VKSVLQRWMNIQTHLAGVMRPRLHVLPQSCCIYQMSHFRIVWNFIQILYTPWPIIYCLKTKELHSVPFTKPRLSSAAHQTKIVQVLRERLSDERGRIATEQFFDFRTQTGQFHPTMQCGMFRDDPQRFWLTQEAEIPVFARLAHRNLSTPANGVACEWENSAMKFGHSTLPNTEDPKRDEKIRFIQMNVYKLDPTERIQHPGSEVPDTDMTEEQLLEMEDEDMEIRLNRLEGRPGIRVDHQIWCPFLTVMALSVHQICMQLSLGVLKHHHDRRAALTERN